MTVMVMNDGVHDEIASPVVMMENDGDGNGDGRFRWC